MWLDIFLFFQFYTQNYKLSIRDKQNQTSSARLDIKWFCSEKTLFYELTNKASNWQIVALTKTLYLKL